MSRIDALLPLPQCVEVGDGSTAWPDHVMIALHGLTGDDERALRRFIAAVLPDATIAEDDAWLRIVIDADLAAERFRLEVDAAGASLTAGSYAGVVWGLQRLLQLRDGASVGPVAIEDEPRFAWRGVLIDVARHFLAVDELRKHIDLLSSCGINRLQLHLTDDQGWRIESKHHPRLHEVGGTRPRSQINHPMLPPVFDEVAHSGFYTQAELAELHRYARDRGIELVPEIDLPGHSAALLAAYPELGAPGVERVVREHWGVSDALVAYTPEALGFLADVVDELLGIADFRFVHIGGDETLLDAWTDDPRVQAYAQQQGLADAHAMLDAFLHELVDRIAGHGVTVLGWDDAFAAQHRQGHVDHRLVITAWRGMRVARRVAASGCAVVLAPILPTYFDYAQAEPTTEPIALAGPITLADVAAWVPIPDGWSEDEIANVLGVQCQAWAELMPTPEHRAYMLYPRAFAFAEVAWRGSARPLEKLQPALDAACERALARGLSPRPTSGPLPGTVPTEGPRAPMPSPPLAGLLHMLEEAALTGTTLTPESIADAMG